MYLAKNSTPVLGSCGRFRIHLPLCKQEMCTLMDHRMAGSVGVAVVCFYWRHHSLNPSMGLTTFGIGIFEFEKHCKFAVSKTLQASRRALKMEKRQEWRMPTGNQFDHSKSTTTYWAMIERWRGRLR